MRFLPRARFLRVRRLSLTLWCCRVAGPLPLETLSYRWRLSGYLGPYRWTGRGLGRCYGFITDISSTFTVRFPPLFPLLSFRSPPPSQIRLLNLPFYPILSSPAPLHLHRLLYLPFISPLIFVNPDCHSRARPPHLKAHTRRHPCEDRDIRGGGMDAVRCWRSW